MGHTETGEVSLNSIEDTYVDSGSPDTNFGNLTDMIVWNGASSNDMIVSWLRFNLSAVPDDAIVDTATLQLWTTDVPTRHPQVAAIDAHSCSDISWDETTMTYSNMPGYNATPIDSENVSAVAVLYNWIVLDAVERTLNSKAPAITFVIDTKTVTWTTDDSWAPTRFASKENEVQVPSLIVQWNQNVPEYQTGTILLLFGLVSATLTIQLARATCTKRKEGNSAYESSVI